MERSIKHNAHALCITSVVKSITYDDANKKTNEGAVQQTILGANQKKVDIFGALLCRSGVFWEKWISTKFWMLCNK